MLRLPDRAHVTLTGETDPILRHYQPLVGYFMNKRLAMGLELLGARRFQRILDAGYGGGVFFPELAARAEELYGVDIHDRAEAVSRMAQAEGIQVRLQQASVTETRFPDAFFDCVVAMSVLEFVDDLPQAMRELARVTRAQGTVVLGFPGENALTAWGYRLARTPDPKRVHRANYQTILAAAGHDLILKRLLTFPRHAPQGWALFFAAEFARP